MSRTGLGNVAIKAAASRADLASLADGRYIFPAFLPAPDCFMTLARALEAFREEPLSERAPSSASASATSFARALECPWSAKGRVMRGLAERFGGDPDAILTDGVQAQRRWRLGTMLPDPDNPVFYVYAETGHGRGNAPPEAHGRLRRARPLLIEDQAMLSS